MINYRLIEEKELRKLLKESLILDALLHHADIDLDEDKYFIALREYLESMEYGSFSEIVDIIVEDDYRSILTLDEDY